jgi:maltose operon protein
MKAGGGITGCTTTSDSFSSFHTKALGLEELKQNNNCCAQLGDINYQIVSAPGEQELNILTTSPKVAFKSGRSFAEGLQLPATLDTITFSVHSNVGASSFVPSILVLDDQYQPLAVIDDPTIQYQPLGLLNSARYMGEIELPQRYVNGKIPTYLVVFTTKKSLSSQSPVEKPSDVAIRAGDIQANIAHNTDYTIPHAAIGKVTFQFDFEPLATATSEHLREERVKEIVEEKSNITTLMPIQNDTNQADLYTELVEYAVKSGDFAKALAYVEESERLGMTDMRNIFVKAMKQYEDVGK